MTTMMMIIYMTVLVQMTKNDLHLWPNWIGRWTSNPTIAGSNPARCTKCKETHCNKGNVVSVHCSYIYDDDPIDIYVYEENERENSPDSIQCRTDHREHNDMGIFARDDGTLCDRTVHDERAAERSDTHGNICTLYDKVLRFV